MLGRIGLYQRILIPFVLIALLGGLAQMSIAGQQLERATYEFYQHHLETDALMVAATLGEPLEQYLLESNDDGLRRAVTVLNQEMRYEYLIVDGEDRIIGYTPGVGIPIDEHALQTPELREVGTGQLGSDVRQDVNAMDRLYVAAPIMYERETIGYLVLSQSMEAAYAEAHSRWLQLAGTTIPVIMLIGIVSLWIAGTIVRPVRQLRQMALEMAHGALDKRITIQSGDDIGQLARAFNFMAEQVDHLLKSQRSFVSSAAHELRTPLMTLKLRLEALADPALDAKQQQTYLDELQREVSHMAELVSSLLVLAQMDEGRHPCDDEVTDVGAVLSDSARHWRIAAQREGLKFDAVIPLDLPPLAIPSTELRLLIDNLLSNAIKYTPAGNIRLRAALNLREVIIEVSDTGVGFASNEASLLFDRFYRSNSTRHTFPGHGLGLSIVRAVLDYYGASIEAQSLGTGKGSRFIIYLPTSA